MQYFWHCFAVLAATGTLFVAYTIGHKQPSMGGNPIPWYSSAMHQDKYKLTVLLKDKSSFEGTYHSHAHDYIAVRAADTSVAVIPANDVACVIIGNGTSQHSAAR